VVAELLILPRTILTWPILPEQLPTNKNQPLHGKMIEVQEEVGANGTVKGIRDSLFKNRQYYTKFQTIINIPVIPTCS
jgi:hypothetical protein